MERETIFRVGYVDHQDVIEQMEYLKEEYGEGTEEQAINDLLETQYMDYDWIMENDDFNEIVLIGTSRLWFGNRESAKYFKTSKELRNTFSNYDEIEFEKAGRHLYVNLHHHDGCHDFEILRLNDKGINILDRMRHFYGEHPELKILDDIDKFKRNYTKCFFKTNKQYLI